MPFLCDRKRQLARGKRHLRLITNHLVLGKLVRHVDECFHLALPNSCVALETRAGEPRRDVFHCSARGELRQVPNMLSGKRTGREEIDEPDNTGSGNAVREQLEAFVGHLEEAVFV